MIETVTWRGTAEIEGPVDTVDEATRSWMDARGISDLSDLDAEDLAAFIAYLNHLPPGVRNSPEFKQLISALTDLQSGLAQNAGRSEEDKLRFQMEFLSLLAKATTATGDGLDIAHENAQSALHSLDVINQWMEDPSSLSGGDIAYLIQHLNNLEALGYSHSDLAALGLGDLATQLATLEGLLTDMEGLSSADPVELTKAMLAAIVALRASGLSDAHLASLGLAGEGGLESQLQEALALYDKKLSESNDPDLASSYLRESLASIVQSRSNKLQADEGLSQLQRDFYAYCSDKAGEVVDLEDQAQRYMEAPVENLELPEPEDMTREGLEAYYQELLNYAKTIPAGSDGEPFRKMVMLKLEEISESLSEMKGNQLTLAQSYGLKMALLAADTWLMESAKDYYMGLSGNNTASQSADAKERIQELIDVFSARAEELNQFANQVRSFHDNLLEQERRVLDKLF